MTTAATTSHPNAVAFARAYDAFGRGDLDALRTTAFQADAVWHHPGTVGIAGDYRGVDAILSLFGRIFQETAGTFRAVPYRILADNDYAVALINTAGTRNGRSLEDREVHVVRMRDGRIAESWLYLGDQPAIDAAWA
jgi:uncharacterized protein